MGKRFLRETLERINCTFQILEYFEEKFHARFFESFIHFGLRVEEFDEFTGVAAVREIGPPLFCGHTVIHFLWDTAIDQGDFVQRQFQTSWKGSAATPLKLADLV